MSATEEDLITTLTKLSISEQLPPPRRSTRLATVAPLSYQESNEKMVKSRTTRRSSGSLKDNVQRQLKTVSGKKEPPIRFRKPVLAKCKDMYQIDTSSKIKVAYYLSGSAGAGKSTIYRSVFSKTPHSYYNVDTYYEYLLNINHLLMRHKEEETRQTLKEEIKKVLEKLDIASDNEGLEFLTTRNISSIKSSLMTIAQKCIKEDMEKMLDTTPTLVIDKPAANFDVIKRELYNPLTKKDYKQYMVFVYTPLFTALKNNRCRSEEETCGRSIYDFIILESWIQSMENIAKFKTLFGEDKVFFVDNSRGTSMSFKKEDIIQELNSYDVKGVSKWVSRIQALEEIVKGITFTPIHDIQEKLSL